MTWDAQKKAKSSWIFRILKVNKSIEPDYNDQNYQVEFTSPNDSDRKAQGNGVCQRYDTIGVWMARVRLEEIPGMYETL